MCAGGRRWFRRDWPIKNKTKRDFRSDGFRSPSGFVPGLERRSYITGGRSDLAARFARGNTYMHKTRKNTKHIPGTQKKTENSKQTKHKLQTIKQDDKKTETKKEKASTKNKAKKNEQMQSAHLFARGLLLTQFPQSRLNTSGTAAAESTPEHFQPCVRIDTTERESAARSRGYSLARTAAGRKSKKKKRLRVVFTEALL